MRQSPPPEPRAVWCALLALLCFVRTATAQDIVVSGTVRSGPGAPIAGVAVRALNSRVEAVSDDAGEFRIRLRTGSQEVMRFERLGFTARDTTVYPAANTRIIFTLTEQPIRLDEVVVTGTAGLQMRRAQAGVVETIPVADLLRMIPLATLPDALQGRVTGLDLTPSSGSSGEAQTIRLRGGTSIALSNEPLVFIDGVRADTRIQSNNANGGQASSRWFDIDPAQIERIEIAKGPAAASLYGADGAAGVIQIFTKRAPIGQRRFSQTIEAQLGSIDANWQPPANYARCSATDVLQDSQARLCHGLSAGAIISDNPLVRGGVLQKGHVDGLHWQAQGAGEDFGIYVSLNTERESGTLPQNAFNRSSGRLGIRWQPAPAWMVDAGFGVMRTRTALPQNGDNPTGLLGALVGNPLTVGTDRDGWYQVPADAISTIEQTNRVLRFLPTLQLSQRTARFGQRFIVGMDASSSTGVQFVPRLDGTFSGVWARGLIGEDHVSHQIYTVDYLGDLHVLDGSSSDWRLDLSAGLQYVETSNDIVSAIGFGLANNDARRVADAAERSGSQSALRTRALGVFAQAQVGFADRAFAQLALRADRHSAFGSSASAGLFPKLGLSFVLLERPDARDFLNTLRFRVAYGTSGRAPAQNEAGATYMPAPYITDAGTLQQGVVPRSPGNAHLEPERGVEVEAGADLGLLRNSLGLELTYFDKRSRNLLLRAPLPPSIGFREDPFSNVGALQNRGLEAAVTFSTPVTRVATMMTTLRVGTLRNELTDLGAVAPFTAFGRFIQGRPLGAFYSYRVVSVDTIAGRAVVSDTTEYIGNPLPHTTASFSTRITLFRYVHVHTALDGKFGYRQANITEDLRDRYMGFGERHARASETSADERLRRFGPFFKASGEAVSAPSVTEPYVQDASFIRWRELSVTGDLPARMIARIGVRAASVTLSARNIKLWTQYDGDPENVSYIAEVANGGAQQYAQPNVLTLPQPQRWVLRVSSRF